RPRRATPVQVDRDGPSRRRAPRTPRPAAPHSGTAGRARSTMLRFVLGPGRDSERAARGAVAGPRELPRAVVQTGLARVLPGHHAGEVQSPAGDAVRGRGDVGHVHVEAGGGCDLGALAVARGGDHVLAPAIALDRAAGPRDLAVPAKRAVH